ncbi:midasin, partial [Trifolium pratense]
DKHGQRKRRTLSDLLDLLRSSGLPPNKLTDKDQRKDWWFLELSGNMQCLLLENSRFASPSSLEIDAKVEDTDVLEESSLREWKTAIEHYFKSVTSVLLLQETCQNPHKDITLEQIVLHFLLFIVSHHRATFLAL